MFNLEVNQRSILLPVAVSFNGPRIRVVSQSQRPPNCLDCSGSIGARYLGKFQETPAAQHLETQVKISRSREAHPVRPQSCGKLALAVAPPGEVGEATSQRACCQATQRKTLGSFIGQSCLSPHAFLLLNSIICIYKPKASKSVKRL